MACAMPPVSPIHALYRRIRPALADAGVLRAARRLFTPAQRERAARLIGLRGFDPGTAEGRAMPAWAARDNSTGPRRAALTGVNYVGDLRADIGISEHSRLTTAALVAAGVPVHMIESAYRFHSRTADAPPGLLHFDAAQPMPVTIIDRNFSHFYDALHDVPLAALENRVRIALWAWELPQFPAHHERNFTLVDEVWAASRFTQDSLALVSPVPVVRMPFGLAPVPSPGSSRGSFGLPDGRMLFLTAFSPASTFARKHPFGTIEAFRRAFAGMASADKPLLVVKTHFLAHDADAGAARALADAVSGVGGVLIDAHLPRQRMTDLLAACDVFVSLHRAEGFGLHIAEAMALGRPVIATGYSGNMDYMTPANSYPAACALRAITEADHAHQPYLAGLYPPGGTWAEPDLDHAAALMRSVYADRTSARRIGAQAALDMARDYSPLAAGLRMRARLERLLA
jgi:glycosyltransferase involved in cell wall biosynthesis